MGTLAVSVGHGAVCRKTELEDLQSICGREAERAYVETEASVFILVTCVSNDGELPVCRPRLPLGWGHWRTSASALQLSPSSLLELFPPALPESCSLPWPLLKKNLGPLRITVSGAGKWASMLTTVLKRNGAKTWAWRRRGLSPSIFWKSVCMVIVNDL